MNVSENAMQKALREFKEWLDNQNIEVSSLLKVTETTSNVTFRDYKKASDIAKRLESYSAAAKDFTDLKTQVDQQNTSEVIDHSSEIFVNESFVDITKSFADIEKMGPKTAGEKKLVNAVNIFLSPQQKQEAIIQNVSVGEIITRVDKSIQEFQKTLTQTILQEKQQEKEKNTSQKVEKQPEEKMSSLGDAYGVMNEIVKSMRTALENQTTKKGFETVPMSKTQTLQTPKAPQKEPQKGLSR